MTDGSPKIKVGQCIRLREFMNAGLTGAGADGYKRLHGKPSLQRRPTYVYLHVTAVNDNKVFGTDLFSLVSRAFEEMPNERWIEFAYSKDTPRIFDIWGCDELTFLGKQDVRDVFKGQRKKLREFTVLATEVEQEYAAATRRIMKSL